MHGGAQVGHQPHPRDLSEFPVTDYTTGETISIEHREWEGHSLRFALFPGQSPSYPISHQTLRQELFATDFPKSLYYEHGMEMPVQSLRDSHPVQALQGWKKDGAGKWCQVHMFALVKSQRWLALFTASLLFAAPSAPFAKSHRWVT